MPVFLFTDIENSTRMWEQYRDVMGQTLSRHDAILRHCIESFGGQIIKHTGDGVFAVFENRGQPLACALEIQRQIQQEQWRLTPPLRIRLALNGGSAERRGGDFFGLAVNRTARLVATAWGGQILLTPSTLEMCPLPSGSFLQDLGLHLFKDLGEPEQVYNLCHADLSVQEFPPLRSLSTRAHNLPPQSTLFIGREKELIEISTLLANPACRLITLIGPGGTGKTRLAIQAAAEKIDLFPQGAYFVPLASLATADLLPSAMSQLLKLNFYSQAEPKQQLLNFLRQKKVLLVMDNFEHLLDGADLVVELLAHAADLKIITTSRARLDIQGEWLLEIDGLPCPDNNQAEAVEQYGAAQLFLESVRRVQPDFTLAAADQAQISRICCLVHGLPLAIELAASWIRLLTLKEIADEIEKSYDFLDTRLRNVPERHRSLRALFDYSWKLLTDVQQETLAQLSLFRGAFTKEAAYQIMGASLFTLADLVDKSLLRLNAANQYQLHELFRQYAAEKLAAYTGQQEKLAARHGAYYAAFVRRLAISLQAKGQKESLEEMALALEEIRQGWQWAVSQVNIPILAQFLNGLSLFYEIRGWFQEASHNFGTAVFALHSSPATLDPESQLFLGLVTVRQATFLLRLGFHQQAQEQFETGLALLRRCNAPESLAYPLNGLGDVHQRRGDYDRAEHLYLESMIISRQSGDDREVSKSLRQLGNLAFHQQNYLTARQFYRESLALIGKLEDLWSMASLLNNLATVAAELDQQEASRRLYQESLNVNQAIGNKSGLAVVLNNLSAIAEAAGDFAEEESLLQQSLAIAKEIGDRHLEAVNWNNLASLTFRQKKYALAYSYYRESLALHEEMNDWRSGAFLLVDLGTVTYHLEQPELAGAYFYQALPGIHNFQLTSLMPRVLLGLAVLRLEQGECAEALGLLLPVVAAPDLPAEQRERAADLMARLEGHLSAEEIEAHGDAVRLRTMAETIATLLMNQRRRE
jgi:predicted ATPase/class 3 adenylate cyclase